MIIVIIDTIFNLQTFFIACLKNKMYDKIFKEMYIYIGDIIPIHVALDTEDNTIL